MKYANGVCHLVHRKRICDEKIFKTWHACLPHELEFAIAAISIVPFVDKYKRDAFILVNVTRRVDDVGFFACAVVSSEPIIELLERLCRHLR